MKVPLEWLKDYVAIRLKPETLADRLTMAGLEVTGIAMVNGQAVFDIEITPNRADCLSIIGIAREVAAMTGQRIKLPQRQATSDKRQARTRPTLRTPHSALRIRIEDRKGCRRYIGRLLAGVTIGPSPSWMQRRLLACGIRPINNVVDITNYVLLESGQPLHAFDFDRLAQGVILVRRAKPKEAMTTLDGVARTLSPDVLVIADAARAVAVAGVMGGVGSEVTPRTTAVLLESAWFDPVIVRRTSRALGLASESSYRFERGVDQVGVETASARAASLICRLAGAAEQACRDVGAKPLVKPAIVVDASLASRWLGLPLSPAQIRSSLARLGCRVSSSESSPLLRVVPPSFRRDLIHDVDCFEELARLIGYERIPATLPTAIMPASRDAQSPLYRHLQSIRCLGASLGLMETVTWSLVSEMELSRCGWTAGEALRVTNPLSQDYAFVRPSMIMGLLRAIHRNLSQGAQGVRIFELGSVVQAGTVAHERASLGVALAGAWSRDWRTKETCDFFRLKGLVDALIQRLCGQPATCRAADVSWADPAEAARVFLKSRAVGAIGRLSRQAASAWDLDDAVWLAELDVTSLLQAQRALESAVAPSPFPPVKRDLSLVVDNAIACDQVASTIREVGGAMAQRVELIDRYTGRQLPPNTYSLTFSIEYRDPARTLTADEADDVHHRIGQALVERFAAHLR